MSEYSKIHVNIPMDLYNTVVAVAYKTGKSITTIVKDALSNHTIGMFHHTPANDNDNTR